MREKTRVQPTFDLSMDDNGKITFELSLLASNIIKEVVGTLDYFFTFLRNYEQKIIHKMFSLIRNVYCGKM
jgi:hypothetical protein